MEDYKALAEFVVKKLKLHQSLDTKTILHVGCGSGCMDYHLKMHVEITGLQLSENMITSALKKNPGSYYLVGDMRSFTSD